MVLNLIPPVPSPINSNVFNLYNLIKNGGLVNPQASILNSVDGAYKTSIGTINNAATTINTAIANGTTSTLGINQQQWTNILNLQTEMNNNWNLAAGGGALALMLNHTNYVSGVAQPPANSGIPNFTTRLAVLNSGIGLSGATANYNNVNWSEPCAQTANFFGSIVGTALSDILTPITALMNNIAKLENQILSVLAPIANDLLGLLQDAVNAFNEIITLEDQIVNTIIEELQLLSTAVMLLENYVLQCVSNVVNAVAGSAVKSVLSSISGG